MIQPYLPKNDGSGVVAKVKKTDTGKYADLCSDEKILLDAFSALPKKIQEEQLLQIVELARKQVHDSKNEA